MKSVSLLLFTAGLVSAVAVPVQLAERSDVQFAQDEKRSLADLSGRQAPAPAPAPSAAPAPPPPEATPAAATEAAQASVTVTTTAVDAQQTQDQKNGTLGQNQGQNQNKDQNQGKDQNKNKDQGKDQNKNNQNKNNNKNKGNKNNNKNNNQEIIIALSNGNALQGLFTPQITTIINSMGLGKNVNAQVLQGLSFSNQVVVLNQLQQLQTLQQLNMVQGQQVITILNQGFSNNGVNVGKSSEPP